MQALTKFGEKKGQKVKFIDRVPTVMTCPQQTNGIDCGMFTGAFAMAIALGVDVHTVHQHKIASYRQQWSAAIAQGGRDRVYALSLAAMLGLDPK